MPLDGARAEEESGRDLGVREVLADETGDLGFLGGELTGGIERASRDGLAEGPQLSRGAFGERLGTHRREHLVGSAQLLARIHAAMVMTQPFAVDQMGAGEFSADPSAAETLDRLAVVPLGGVVLGHQRSRASLDPESPLGATGTGRLREPPESICGTHGYAGAAGCLDELDQHPPSRHALLREVLTAARGRSHGVLMAALTVADHHLRPHADGEARSFLARMGVAHRLDALMNGGLMTLPGSE